MIRQAPKTVGIAANAQKPESRTRLVELLRLLEQQRVAALLEPAAAELAGRAEAGRPLREIGERAELVVVLGGDGTILRVVRELPQTGIPILGINMGGLGFLTSVRAEELTQTMREILRGEYELSDRQTLQATLIRDGTQLQTHRALNDAVVSRGVVSRIVRLKVFVDGELLTEYVCDGMIFATATGSTAYSLSAGGPIVLPTAGAWVITPICPHALSNRSVIVGENSTVRCEVASAAGELVLTVDGQVQLPMQVGDTVQVQRAPQPVRLVVPRGHAYFDVLRQKLKWSGANV